MTHTRDAAGESAEPFVCSVSDFSLGEFREPKADVRVETDGVLVIGAHRRAALPAGGLRQAHGTGIACYRHAAAPDECDQSPRCAPGFRITARDATGQPVSFAVADWRDGRALVALSAEARGPSAARVWRSPWVVYGCLFASVWLLVAVSYLGLGLARSLDLQQSVATVTSNAEQEDGQRRCAVSWPDTEPGSRPVAYELRCAESESPGSTIDLWWSRQWWLSDPDSYFAARGLPAAVMLAAVVTPLLKALWAGVLLVGPALALAVPFAFAAPAIDRWRARRAT